MPEGPELHLSARFVSTSCKGRIFTGKVVKSEVHKSSEVPFEAKAYSVTACSRGKEMQLMLTKLEDDSKSKSKPGSKSKLKMKPNLDADSNCTKILFRFGMSGKFEFTSVENIHKHAHLKFFTNDKPPMVLSHVDVRRFGRWQVNADWSKDRGPDPMFEYLQFRANVVNNLDNNVFNQPICEVLLNQKYFNGIGNYLRAEILYRLRIPPFEKARTVLQGLSIEPPDAKPGKAGKKGKEQPDILHICHTIPLEVLNIGGGGYDPEGNKSDYTSFTKWLQCYYKDGMNNMVDHNGRTIWFTGPAGPMVPKEGKSRSKKTKKRRAPSKNTTMSAEENGDISPPKKAKAVSKPPARAKKTQKKTPASRRKGRAAQSKTATPASKGPVSSARRKAAAKTDGTVNVKTGASRDPSRKKNSTPKQASGTKKTPMATDRKSRRTRSRTAVKK